VKTIDQMHDEAVLDRSSELMDKAEVLLDRAKEAGERAQQLLLEVDVWNEAARRHRMDAERIINDARALDLEVRRRLEARKSEGS
jgi:hypothetical protein